MGFYDSWNFDGLKLFSQIKTHPLLATPCEEILYVIKSLKQVSSRNITVAEIGIGYGATALPVLQMLDAGDTYYGFDFEDRIAEFVDDLQARDFGLKCAVVVAGNSRSPSDSYNWNLSNLILRMRERREAGLFDVVYLNGAHTFLYTGLGVCLLKELLKEGGFLILDDLFWTIAKSPTVREEAIRNNVPRVQMEDPQVFRVQEIFLSNDPNFEKLSAPQDRRGIFRKHSRR